MLLIWSGVLSCLAAPGDLRWSYRTGGTIRTTPAIGPDGVVYFGSSLGGLQAVEGATGAKRWSFSTGPLVASPALGPDGTVYVAEQSSGGAARGPCVYAIDPDRHAPRWTFTAPAEGQGFLAAPALSQDGVVYVLSAAHWLHALSAESGQALWQVRVEDSMVRYASPVVGADGTIYLGLWSDARALDPDSGRNLWVHPTESFWEGTRGVGGFQASPALGPDGAVYLGSTSGLFLALDGLTGETRWSVKPAHRITSSAAIGADGTVYFGSDEGWVNALDGATGARRWRFETGGPVHSSPTLTADGAVVVGSYDHQVYGLDAATGARRWSFATGDKVLSSAAVAADGTIYIGSFDGRLYALEGVGALAASPWPKFRGGADNRGSGESTGPPRIVAPAASQFVAADSVTTLGPLVGGDRPISFQWSFENQPIDGATSARLTLNRLRTNDAGEYRLTASNASGSIEVSVELRVGFRLLLGQRIGGTVTRAPVQDLYLPGASIELIALPDDGRSLVGWLGDASGTANPIILVMDGHRTVAADFGTVDGDIVWESPEGDLAARAFGPDGTFYLGLGWPDSALHALDPLAGLPRWTLRVEGGAGVHRLAVGHRGVLYAHTGDGRVRALDSCSGRELWWRQDAGELALGPNGWVYLRRSGAIEAVDGATGNAKWRVPLAGSHADPLSATAEGLVLVPVVMSNAPTNSFLVALDGLTGNELWRFEPGGAFRGPTVGRDGTAYLGGDDGLRAVNGATGAERWKVRLAPSLHTPPTVGADGRLFVTLLPKGLFALVPDTGEVIWQLPDASHTGFPPVLGSDGALYVLASADQLHVLDAASGETRWRRTLPWECSSLAPALGADPTLILYQGWPVNRLLAIRVGAGLASSPWPAPDGDAGNSRLAYRPLRLWLSPTGRGNLSFSADTTRGVSYALECTDHFPSSRWTILTNFTGDGTRRPLADPGPHPAHRFYRLRSW